MTSSNSSNKFPVKLFQILQEAEHTPYLADIVSWLPDGKSFKVHNKDEFSTSILPAAFGTNVYKSFQRNLHFWGFHNTRKGTSKGVCSHSHFVRGRPDLLSKMRRVRAPSKNNENSEGSPSPEQQQQQTAASSSAQEDSSNNSRSRNKIPPFIFATNHNDLAVGAGTENRVVSPSTTSIQPTTSAQVQAMMAADQQSQLSAPNLDTAALLLLLQQQNNSSNANATQQLQDQLQQQQQQQLLAQALLARQNDSNANATQHIHQEKLQQQQQQQLLAQALLVRQILELQQKQQQQQQQQRQLQELVASLMQPTQSAAPTVVDQNSLTRALVSQLLSQQGNGNGGANNVENLLSFLM